MKIKIEEKEYVIPTSLMDITLWERIEFDKKYGKALREKLQKIIEMKSETLRDIEFTGYHCELACKTLSFFGKIPIEIIEGTRTEEVLAIYHAVMRSYSEDVDFNQQEKALQLDFVWNDEEWRIQPPQLKYNSSMTTGEFLDAKQWVKNLWELSQEKWEALLMLCCVYFRKKDEAYSKEMPTEESSRYLLMKKLPLEMAIHVGFFLSSSMDLYARTLHSSRERAEQAVRN